MDYSIKEISERLRIPASTLRYYEKRGLIGPLRRSTGQVRVFSEEDLKLLQIIQCLKRTGMPVEEIREFVGPVSYTHLDVYKRQRPGERHR